MSQAPEVEETLGSLVAKATDQISTLVRAEIELAKSELRFDAKRVGTGVGLLAGAAFIAHLCLILASFTLGYLLSEGMWTWLAVVLTVLAYLATGAFLGYLALLGARTLGNGPSQPVGGALAGVLFLEVTGAVLVFGLPHVQRWIESFAMPAWLTTLLPIVIAVAVAAVLGYLASLLARRFGRGLAPGAAIVLFGLAYLALAVLFGYLAYLFVPQLAAGLPNSAAFLIVTLFYLLVAGVAVLIGTRRFKGLTGMKRTRDSLKGLKDVAEPADG
ncbi:MAG: phage holin family protein [Thermoactinospora sp.]|nr:phage holin family protein [Thermoactinospora sp.]